MSVIEVDNITKEFKLGQLMSLKHAVLNTFERFRGKEVEKPKSFKALNNVAFKVEAGEVLGIIGANGAGKSTLLKMLARISVPTSGNVTVKGSVAPLIEVGAGLVGDLTGRENVYLNGSILGLSRAQIRRKFDEIVAFSELEEFIDTPIKRYSSGMAVRLGFSVATSVDADILIVDEVLAVGDLAFQRKCFDRIENMIMREGRTVLIVSHNIRQIERMCKRAILLENGRIAADGNSKQVCDEFYARSQSKISSAAALSRKHRGRYESTGEIDVLSLSLEDQSGCELGVVHKGDAFSVRIRLRCHVDLHNVTIGLGIHTTDFVYLTTHNSEITGIRPSLKAGDHDIFLRISHFPLLPGVYMWRMGITCGEAYGTVFYGENLLQTSVIIRDKIRVPASMHDGFFTLDGTWDFGASSETLSNGATRSKSSDMESTSVSLQ
jgi:lipopolysaccharide transport system ATP-binding protein